MLSIIPVLMGHSGVSGDSISLLATILPAPWATTLIPSCHALNITYFVKECEIMLIVAQANSS